MLQKGDLGRLLEYTVWANHRIVRAAATLTVDEFKSDHGGSYGGVRGTLAHILGAEWIWLERWKGVSPGGMMDESEFPDVMALRQRWQAIEEHRQAWFDALKKDAPRSIVRYKNTQGSSFGAPLWQLVQHVVNHSTYHRGQVTNFLRATGAKTVSTDLVIWDRDRTKKAATAS